MRDGQRSQISLPCQPCGWQEPKGNFITSHLCTEQDPTLAKHYVPTAKYQENSVYDVQQMTSQTGKVHCIPKWGGTGISISVQIPWSYIGLKSDVQKKPHKNISNIVKFNLRNFKQIRPFLKSYLHCMIFSHIEYCFNIWSFACITTLKPI